MKVTHESKVEYVNHMGDDLSVVNAARVSFAKYKEQFDDGDRKLIHYLAREGHWTPFGHAVLSVRVTAPIFVARQLVKHQVGLVWNEESRRYITEEPVFYIPRTWRNAPANAKQGSSGEAETWKQKAADVWLNDSCQEALVKYEMMVERGIAPEQARMILPLNAMTSWIWTGSLMAFSRVCKLRLDSHSQVETADVARKIFKILYNQFPVSVEALLMEPDPTKESHNESNL